MKSPKTGFPTHQDGGRAALLPGVWCAHPPGQAPCAGCVDAICCSQTISGSPLPSSQSPHSYRLLSPGPHLPQSLLRAPYFPELCPPLPPPPPTHCLGDTWFLPPLRSPPSAPGPCCVQGPTPCPPPPQKLCPFSLWWLLTRHFQIPGALGIRSLAMLVPHGLLPWGASLSSGEERHGGAH